MRLHVAVGTTKPVVTVLREVTILQVVVQLIRVRGLRVELALSERWLSNGDIDIVIRWLITGLGDDLVDITGSASVHIVLLRNVSGISGQIFLLIINIGVMLHRQ